MAKQQKQFIQLYYDAIVALGITDAVVYCYLLGCDNKYSPTIKEISAACGMSVRTTNSSLARLKEMGLVKYNSGSGIRNSYQLEDVQKLHNQDVQKLHNAKIAQPKCKNCTTNVQKLHKESAKIAQSTSKIMLDKLDYLKRENNPPISPQEDLNEIVNDIERHYKEMRADIENETQVRNLLMMDLKVMPDKLLALLDEYHRNLVISGADKRIRTEYRWNFIAWSKKQIKREQDEQRRKTNIPGKHPNADFSDDFKRKLAKGLGLTE